MMAQMLSNRVYKGQQASHRHHYHVEEERSRRPAYKEWDVHRMSMAINAVHRGQSIRRAVIDYGVPKSTLGDGISGRVLDGSRSGPQPYLSDKDEKELYKFIMACASVGYPKTRQDVLAIVQQLIQSRGGKSTDKVVTGGWYRGWIVPKL